MPNLTNEILTFIQQLKQKKFINALDQQFALWLHRSGAQALTLLASVFVSHKLSQGNICLPLDKLNSRFLLGQQTKLIPSIAQLIDQTNWIQALSNCPLVSNGKTLAPLVVEKNRLYLYRYWSMEQYVTQRLCAYTKTNYPNNKIKDILSRLFAKNYQSIFLQLQKIPHNKQRQEKIIDLFNIVQTDSINWTLILQTIDQAKTAQDLIVLDQLIPNSACLDWQKIAIIQATLHSFCVISGGPGTGKTTTVTRLLALLIELEQSINHKNLKIHLVAPTGKAAMRLTESINNASNELNFKISIPNEATTLHRLLGAFANGYEFRYNAKNLLSIDVLIVDEASMVDLTMMTNLLQALPASTKLILLGDKDQLSSVEAGSVLGDICLTADLLPSKNILHTLSSITEHSIPYVPVDTTKTTQIQDCLCLLKKSFRFHSQSGIGQLAYAINQSNLKKVKQVCQTHFSDLHCHWLDETSSQPWLPLCIEQYQPFLEAIIQEKDIEDIFTYFHKFKLLCAVREGYCGVIDVNKAIEQRLKNLGKINITGQWYVGRPILITQNDYQLGLYNGDIGITVLQQDKLRVVFQTDTGYRSILPNRLPTHETVFAMTIHKSQGSEFNHTAIILPDKISPLLSKELLYTGITRAKQHLDIFAQQAIFDYAVTTAKIRFSGLSERLQSKY